MSADPYAHLPRPISEGLVAATPAGRWVFSIMDGAGKLHWSTAVHFYSAPMAKGAMADLVNGLNGTRPKFVPVAPPPERKRPQFQVIEGGRA